LKFDAWENGPFEYPDQELVPIIFMHGLTANGSLHYGYCAELASHGYLVLNVDFIDGSGGYTELQDGKKIYFDLEHLPLPLDYRQEFVKAYRPFYDKKHSQI
jgi:hypothetical protein